MGRPSTISIFEESVHLMVNGTLIAGLISVPVVNCDMVGAPNVGTVDPPGNIATVPVGEIESSVAFVADRGA